MAAADEELLQLLRAVKTHHQNLDNGGADNDDVLGQDYADAFDEDAILLCLNAIQAAADARQWRASDNLTALTTELLDWDVSALDVTGKTKTELQVARWAFVSRAIETRVVPESDDFRDFLVDRMTSERFAALDVQYAVVQCLMLAVQRGVVGLSDVVLELVKQFYVTLSRVAVRELLVQSLIAIVKDKDDVKHLIGVGSLRAIVQVSLMEERSAKAKGLDEDDDDDAQELETLARLMQNSAMLLRHVGSLVCLKGSEKPGLPNGSDVARLCDAVVQLLLSRVSVVFDAAIRLLQMLVESPTALAVLPSIPDLRGALEKAKTLATKPEVKPTVQDPYVRSLCDQLYTLLIPLIQDYETRHGSLVGLFPKSSSDHEVSSEKAFEAAMECKSRGNTFYQRGNFATARLFYRRAIAIVKAAEFQAEQKLASLTIDDVRKRCSIGASVQVVQRRSGSLRSAMVSDVEDDKVEVLYDDGEEEEELVSLTRIRLRMDTSQLEQFKTVTVDCSMNMGKAFTMLFDYESAVECFTHVLSIQSQYIAALYHRGVAFLVLHDLKQAQQDLWQANQLCSKWKTLGNPVEAKKKKALHAQIVAAYKKLQTLHASKKKVDKKLVKQMLSYISTIPGLQDGEQDDEE